MSHTKKSVILIDDDHVPMEYFVDALKMAGFDVTHLDETDVAIPWIRNWPEQYPKPDLFIIDMMMPCGEYLGVRETDDGIKTGCFIVRECRKHLPETPTVCLTNFNGIDELTDLLGPVTYFAKYEISPFDFANEMKKILNNEPRQG